MDENTEQITAAEEGDFADKSVLRKEVILREEGRSLLPVSRVQRIIKADKELPLVAKEAVFAISIATEEFIKRITLACYRQAEREKRVTIQRKDIALVAKRADEFFFLEDILSGLSTSEPQRKAEPRRPKKLSTVDTTGTNPLENFVKSVLSTQNDQDGRDEDEMMS